MVGTQQATRATTAGTGDGQRPVARCTVVIPVHNKASLTRQCLDTLLAERVPEGQREIVVVDDGSIDLTPDLLRAYADRVRVVRHAAAVGFAGACTAGAALARGDYIVLLNNDTIPQPGWLDALIAYADDHPAAAIVGAKLLFPNDTIQHAGIAFGLGHYPVHLYAGFPADHPATSVSRRFQAVTAACCLIRRSAWEEADGFDRGFVNGWEDVDLCLRLGAAGHEIHYCADAVVYHLESATRDLRAAQERANRARFAERWLDRIRPDDFEYYYADGLISILYPARYPIQVSFSPLLAGMMLGEHERLGDNLLFERARQSMILLRNNLLLNVRVQEAELREQAALAKLRRAEEQLALLAGPESVPAVAAAAAPDVAAAISGRPLPAAAGTAPGAVSAPPAPAAAQGEPILGRIESPSSRPGVVTDPVLPVLGWALSKAGMRTVETLVDGVPVGTVAYGEPRPDIAPLHPEFPDAEHCGFAGFIPMEDLADGEHRIEIRLIGKDGRVSTAATTFEVDSQALASGRVICRLDKPTPNQSLARRDRLYAAGWALSPHGIASVVARIDGGEPWPIAYGGLRQDVGRFYAFYPNAAHSGFSASLPIGGLADGSHQLDVLITAEDGQTATLTAPFTVGGLPPSGEVPAINEQYDAWLERQALSPARVAALATDLVRLPAPPAFGIVVPVPPGEDAAIVVAGLRDQVYGNWRLYLVTDAAAPEDSRRRLADLAASDQRITLVEATGTWGTLAAAGAAAREPWLAVLPASVRLTPDALAEAALAIGRDPDAAVLYADDDRIDPATGKRFDPFFKPDWSPDLHLALDYLGPFVLYRRDALDAARLAEAPVAAERYDLALRATERTSAIRHLPRVLATLHATPAPDPAARQAVAAALARRGLAADVEAGIRPDLRRVRYPIADAPAVTILMPSGGKLRFLRPCLDDLLHKTDYPNLRILIVDNSDGDDVGNLVADRSRAHPNLRRERVDLKPFNFSALINRGLAFVTTPYVLLLNDDVTVVNPDWLTAMMEHAQRPEVGVVGAKLLFPDGTIQHAGVVLGPYQGTGHLFKLYPGDDPGWFGLPDATREYSAVTFACALLRTEVLREVGGLDEANLPIAFNDVDTCLRIGERGYRVVYTPHAQLVHHESVTKTVVAEPREIGLLRSRWGHVIEHDPFYNPNLTRKGEDASLRWE